MRSEAHTDYNYNNLKFSADVTVHRGAKKCATRRRCKLNIHNNIARIKEKKTAIRMHLWLFAIFSLHLLVLFIHSLPFHNPPRNRLSLLLPPS